MKKFIVGLFLLALSVCGSFACGGADPCAELETICNKCKEAPTVAACKLVVNGARTIGQTEACRTNLDNYKKLCP